MVCLFSVVIAFLVLFAFPEETISLFIWIGGIAIAHISAILYFVEQAVGTTIVIEDKTIIIKYIIRRKKIAVRNICNLNIEKYKRIRPGNRYRRGYTEYRMKMTMELLNGKKLVLTDRATAVIKGGLLQLAEYREVPDEDVNLYKAHAAIRQRCIKYNGWQTSETENADLPVA